jgi:hypothetical protein
MNYSDRIKPDSKHISTFLDDLLSRKYQIPTFQREIVWDKNNIKKLWDSIFRFYPLGSFLIWKTSVKLHNHRDIGGFVIHDENEHLTEYQYILDGQQRTTSLLTSLYGRKILGKEDFNPTLYIDLTVEEQTDPEEENYKKMFLFWDEIDDKNGQQKSNTQKKIRYDEGLIVKLNDIRQDYEKVEERIVEHPSGNYKEYQHPVRKFLRKIKSIFDNYKISFIELKGIQVNEVCQIFERINQEGKPLSIFDIIVAKTYKPKTDSSPGFYLRELIEKFRKTNSSNYLELDDLTFLQILAILIKQNIPDSGIVNITDKYLNNMKTEQIEHVWQNGTDAMLRTFDFLENHLHLKGPQLVPYRYFYLTLATYFYTNRNPDYQFLKEYFWYHSFHTDDLLANTQHLFKHIELLDSQKQKKAIDLEPFKIDRDKLRKASYSSKGRMSRAVLSLYANQDPKDWKLPDRSVLVDVYYALTDKPNLHHIFPDNYIRNHPGTNKLDVNSIMNIAYLTQITNLEISDKNPLVYLKDYDVPAFADVMRSHLISEELIKWSRVEYMPENALDLFIESRIDNILEQLKKNITITKFEVIDTKTTIF